MKLAEMITENDVLHNFRAKDKWETIDLLLAHLVKTGRIVQDQVKPVKDAVVARESIASTGLENGIALPHATVDALSAPVAVLAISKKGVPFESSDGKPATLIILIAIPRQTQRTYVRTLAGIARLLNYDSMRKALCAAKSAAEVMKIIREEEAKGS